jgi:hypothetical protein
MRGSGLTQVQADALYVNLTGDTMTGALTLNADPVVALGADESFTCGVYRTVLNAARAAD